jgi:hypothetical protein
MRRLLAALAGVCTTLEQEAKRALHWQANADPWQYVLTGSVELTVDADSLRIPPPLADRLPERNAFSQACERAGHGLTGCP